MSIATLTVIYGPMFAGKTTRLIHRIQELESQGKRCLTFKPQLDTRYGTDAHLHAHGGEQGAAHLVDEHTPSEILGKWVVEGEQHTVVAIDEVMFFDPSIVEVIKELLAREIDVIAAGLDTTFAREPFGPMPKLMKLADLHDQLYGTCYKCGKPARYSERLKGGSATIEVGSSDQYQPACGLCHSVQPNPTLGSLVFPSWRLPRKTKYPRIEVAADSMRVGKSTAVKVIAEGLRQQGMPVEESYEDWQHNPYLKQSYADPSGGFLESQQWFVQRKWQQIKGARPNAVFVQDVSPETDFCYAATNLLLGRMSPRDFETYAAYYQSLDWGVAPAPDLLVYLTVSDDGLLKRAEASKREFETVEPEYFLTMKRVNQAWLAQAKKQMKVLVVDTDRFDFANEQSARDSLVGKVLYDLQL